jgi:signal transduction histidine kinase
MNTRVLSIRSRIASTLLWVSLLTGAITIGLVKLIVSHEMDELMNQELRQAAEIIHNVLALNPSIAIPDSRISGDSEYEEHLVWQLIDTQAGLVTGRSHKAPELPLQQTITAEPVLTSDGKWRSIAIGFKHDTHKLLIVAQSEVERDEAQNNAVLYTFLGSLLTTLVFMVLINMRLRQELQPLSQLSLDVQSYDPLVPATTPKSTQREELLPIQHAIEDLGHRLAQRIVSERAFTSHASHALRTPVAGLDIQLAMAIKEAPPFMLARLQRARNATTRLGHVMQALLAMFRTSMEPHRSHVALSEFVTTLSFNTLAIEIEADTPVNVDADLLTAVLLNLFDNAQRHHAQRVILKLLHREGKNVLSVCDDGEGCPPQKLQSLREALNRQDYSSEEGLKGLGLILADLVMRAHGGDVDLVGVSQGFCVELIWKD